MGLFPLFLFVVLTKFLLINVDKCRQLLNKLKSELLAAARYLHLLNNYLIAYRD